MKRTSDGAIALMACLTDTRDVLRRLASKIVMATDPHVRDQALRLAHTVVSNQAARITTVLKDCTGRNRPRKTKTSVAAETPWNLPPAA